MKIQELEEWLEILLDKGKSEKVKVKLDGFKEDTWLIENLSSTLEKKELRDLKLEDILPVTSKLDSVVLAEYPIENPTQYSPLYMSAIKSDRLQRFGKILSHLNRISQIEKSIVSSGIQKNPNFSGQEYGNADRRLYVFDDSSYLSFMSSILNESQDTMGGMLDIDERLGNFEAHIKSLKEQGINLETLFSLGYANNMKILDYQNRKDRNKFPETAEKVTGLLKKLDSLGFDIYHKSSIAKIFAWLNENKLDQIFTLSDYLSKEALMYISALHLKKEYTKL